MKQQIDTMKALEASRPTTALLKNGPQICLFESFQQANWRPTLHQCVCWAGCLESA
jgi:hypothetical protein